MSAPLKISSYENGNESPFETPARYEFQPTSSGGQRLVAGVPDGNASTLFTLLKEMEAPFFILYVLHTPRGEAEPGRYQSPEVSAEEAQNFILRFQEYLAADARFDLWIHSPSSQATLVWDRHNQMYCYGPLERFSAALRAMSFVEQRLPSIGAHIHHYRMEYDSQARELLQAFHWSKSPLRPGDEQ